MRIAFTEPAIAALRAQFGPDVNLRLIYDTEGCGCAVNGVPALRVIARAEPDDARAESDAFAVYYAPRQAVFFEEELTVGYAADKRSFILKSKQQIYSGSMDVRVERIQSATEGKA